MKTQFTSIIPGEDTIIHTKDNSIKGKRDSCAVNTGPARLTNEEKIFMLSNYRLETDNGELFIAMFG
ncbi:MAG: hypothetical protein V4577_26645 [Bacteroidota bacterium]